MPRDQKGYNDRRRKKPEYVEAQKRRYRAWYERCGRTKERLAHKAEKMRAYRADPEKRIKHAARWIANKAMKKGIIEKLPCAQCGAEQAQKHHPDYSQPLLIVWLCRICHQQLHAKATGGTQ